MAPRQYRLGQRAEAAEQTRRRITQATLELHTERGIARTSMKDIAERADVGIGTVYHHFPAYNDAITACGNLVFGLYPPPSPEALDPHHGMRRVEVMVAALMEYWSRIPFVTEMRCERAHYPALAVAAAGFDAWQADFVHSGVAALGIRPDQEAMVLALTDYAVWDALHGAGLDLAAATEAVTEVLSTWLRSTKRKGR